MLFKNVSIHTVAHLEAPIRVTSAEISTRLAKTLSRLRLPLNYLERMTGIKERRFWDKNQLPSEVATLVAAKKAVLLSFRLNDMAAISGGNGGSTWWDKVPSKFDGWGDNQWRAAGFRAVPGSIVRRSAFIGKNVVLMPSFVNVGAFVDEGSMVDGWATVGSCAQIGRNVHLSGGVGIGGVLEPMQAGPTIIEDNCFIGARSEVVEGCIIREGSVLGMGVFIGQSTKIVDRETGAVMYGEVPAGSVVVAGSMPSKNGINLYCAVIVKKVDAKTRSKTSINELLRD